MPFPTPQASDGDFSASPILSQAHHVGLYVLSHLESSITTEWPGARHSGIRYVGVTGHAVTCKPHLSPVCDHIKGGGDKKGAGGGHARPPLTIPLTPHPHGAYALSRRLPLPEPQSNHAPEIRTFSVPTPPSSKELFYSLRMEIYLIGVAA